MLMQEERELVVEYGRKMSTDRLSTGTSGNISVCNAEKGLMAISPSGMDYFSLSLIHIYMCIRDSGGRGRPLPVRRGD